MSAGITFTPAPKTIDERIMRLSSMDNPNAQLAARILSQAQTDKLTLDRHSYSEEYRANGRENLLNDLVAIVDTEKFLQNPIHHILDELISRAAKQQFENYEDINILATYVPDFKEKICKNEGLKSLAAERYENHPKKNEILAVFNKSLEDKSFKGRFAQAVHERPRPIEPLVHRPRSSRSLIKAISIFVTSENLMPYKDPDPIVLEKIPKELRYGIGDVKCWSWG